MVRQGVIEDLPAIKALAYLALYETTTYCEVTPDFELYEEMLLSDRSFGVWVSETEDGDLDGFLIGQLQRGLFFMEKIAVNISFYVVPQRRGTMIPFFLLQRFEWWAKNNKVAQIHISTSGGINIAKNYRFFRGLGYMLSGIACVKELRYEHSGRKPATAEPGGDRTARAADRVDRYADAADAADAGIASPGAGEDLAPGIDSGGERGTVSVKGKARGSG